MALSSVQANGPVATLDRRVMLYQCCIGLRGTGRVLHNRRNQFQKNAWLSVKVTSAGLSARSNTFFCELFNACLNAPHTNEEDTKTEGIIL